MRAEPSATRSWPGELLDGPQHGCSIAAPPEMVGALERLPHRAGDRPGKVFARLEANRAIAAPMHDERGHVDAVQFGAQITATSTSASGSAAAASPARRYRSASSPSSPGHRGSIAWVRRAAAIASSRRPSAASATDRPWAAAACSGSALAAIAKCVAAAA